jgi:hypothetical protein
MFGFSSVSNYRVQGINCRQQISKVPKEQKIYKNVACLSQETKKHVEKGI